MRIVSGLKFPVGTHGFFHSKITAGNSEFESVFVIQE